MASVIGIIGTVRPYGDGELKWERDDEIGRAVSYIRKNFRNELAIADLIQSFGT